MGSHIHADPSRFTSSQVNFIQSGSWKSTKQVRIFFMKIMGFVWTQFSTLPRAMFILVFFLTFLYFTHRFIECRVKSLVPADRTFILFIYSSTHDNFELVTWTWLQGLCHLEAKMQNTHYSLNIQLQFRQGQRQNPLI